MHNKQLDPGHRNKYTTQNQKNTQEETPFFWYTVGVAVLMLIINDVCHIFSGKSLWFHLLNL